MNKNHRIVWSEVRKCFVVASENAKSKGKPSSTRKTIAAAIAALFISPMVAAGTTCTGSTSITTALTDQQCYTDQSVTIGSTGSITVNDTRAVYVNAPDYTSTFVNNGTITGNNQSETSLVHFTGNVSGTITNNGAISAHASHSGGYSVTGLYVGGTLSGTLTNSSTGTISVSGNGTDATSYYGIYINGDIASTGTLTNAGNITVDVHGVNTTASAVGIYVNGNMAGTLNNSGHITVNAYGQTSAFAYGILVDGTLSGTINNSGTISATAQADTSYAYAYGIYINNDLAAGGKLINSGTISATSKVYSDSTGAAFGVYIGGDLAGSLTNSGTIGATAINTHSYTAYAYGVYVDGSLSGTLTNSGTISATATANTSHAYAYGVYVGSDLSGSLINSGSISATANVYSDSNGYAYGVYVGGTLSGSLNNSGTISATANNSHSNDPYAFGVYLNNGIATNGTLTNSGTIRATANANSSSAYAYGVYVGGTLAGSLTNTSTGTISAAANGTQTANHAYAYGVYVNNLTGTLNNAGTITAVANNNYSSAYAYGVYVDNSMTGTITNSGTISANAIATNPSNVYAYGVYMNGGIASGGTLTNTSTGTISAVASGDGGSAYGVYVNNTMAGTITNNGTISAVYNGLSDNANGSASGVYINTLTGSLTNTGTISAINHAAGGSAYGVQINTLTGSLTNSGTISGLADGGEGQFSVYVNAGTGTINNNAGGLMLGDLYVGGTVAVNNAGTIDIPMHANGNPGSGYISGNYSQAATGLITLGATSAGKGGYSQMTVNGVADMTGSNRVGIRPTQTNTLAVGDTLDNVVSAGSWVGLASGAPVTVVSSPLFTFTGVEDGANHIDVTLTEKKTFAQVFGNTGGLGGLGGALDGFAATYGTGGAFDGLLDTLYGLGSQDELDRATKQLLPLLTTGTTGTITNNMHGINRIIQARQDSNHGLSSGDEFFGDRNFWLKPVGSWANQDDRKGVTGYDAKTYGMVIGADAKVSDAMRVGAAFSYMHSKVDNNTSTQNAKIDSYQAIVYGSQVLDANTEINLQADIGLNQNDGKRSIALTGATANSSFDTWTYHVGAGLGRTYAVNSQTTFTPSVRADYTKVQNDGYIETGAGILNLNVNKNDADELILAVDGKLTHAIDERTKFTANLGLGYDVLSEQSSITSSFVGGGASFTTKGLDPSPWLIRGGLGMIITTNSAVEVTARYDIEHREDFNNQTASVKARWAF